jgi:REP element-mobilizing transposase RayT
MGFKYRIFGERAYFLTLTAVDCIDVFTRKNHKLTIVVSLRYCHEKKGLKIYLWCLMPSHLHLIASADEPNNLSEIIRDFKKFTAKRIVEQIQEEAESRREWLLDKLAYNGRISVNNTNYKLWQEGNHPVELFSSEFTKQKLD